MFKTIIFSAVSHTFIQLEPIAFYVQSHKENVT